MGFTTALRHVREESQTNSSHSTIPLPQTHLNFLVEETSTLNLSSRSCIFVWWSSSWRWWSWSWWTQGCFGRFFSLLEGLHILASHSLAAPTHHAASKLHLGIAAQHGSSSRNWHSPVKQSSCLVLSPVLTPALRPLFPLFKADRRASIAVIHSLFEASAGQSDLLLLNHLQDYLLSFSEKQLTPFSHGIVAVSSILQPFNPHRFSAKTGFHFPQPKCFCTMV